MVRLLLALEKSSHCLYEEVNEAVSLHDDLYLVGSADKMDQLEYLLPFCDVALVGPTLEGKPTADFFRNMRSKNQDIRILVIGIDDDPNVILRYIEAGASGYILQSASASDVRSQVAAAREGQAMVSPSVAARMMQRVAQLARQPVSHARINERVGDIDELTPREMEVLELVECGLSNQEIAAKLFIQCGTVKNHVHNILKKLEASNREIAAAIYKAYQREEAVI
jgi:DNA-binding NarL/FixJ family response regulator